jgi:bla regulator protein BlaR1
MVNGRYYEDWTPGAVMGTIWEGYYTAELADELGNTLAQTDFSGLYNSGSEPLFFSLPFSIEFDDYNNDGDTDFTIGQYSTSNGRDYKLFTIRRNGHIEELPVRDYPTLFISNTTGYYSTRLTKINETTFKKEYYDNSTGKHYEDTFKWDTKEFVRIKNEEINT